MGAYSPSPQTPELQSSHHKAMLMWEPIPELNSCIIPWEYGSDDQEINNVHPRVTHV